ncbi:ATP-binding protein [Leptolyngbya sp. GGD]|uniref:ATP-binding protein n=1 Tax=Leptolyngbya sp. GGD TaxID=2997907 RepID=UPI00227BED21|nr:ATP-binding protein [Leptolyngbya sp. GGD]MCY6489817.1 ATP-binding protein [Leptolyngbya sp. GGD]
MAQDEKATGTEDILIGNQIDAFCIVLNDALRPLTDAEAIQSTAAHVLGESLGASRVAYAEILLNPQQVSIYRSYTNGVAELSGVFSTEEYGRDLIKDYRMGQQVIVSDIQHSKRLTEREKAKFKAIDIAAYCDTPLIKNGQLVALLIVHQSTPRQWTKLEARQIEETAERTWAAVERARAEAALRQSETKYRTLFESMNQGFCLCEMMFDEQGNPQDYRFLEANSIFESMTGLKGAIGKTARELVPNLEEFWFETYSRVVQTRKPERFESGSQAMDRWFEVSAFPIDTYPQFAILFTDISDRKQAAIALQDSEEQSRNILESITDGFFALNAQWQFTYMNKSAEALLERSSNASVSKNLWTEYPGLIGTEFERIYRGAMHDQVVGATTAFYPDHNRWYEVRAYPARPGITVYFRNVTEQIQAQAALQHSEKRYQTLFESIDEGFCVIELVFEKDIAIDYRLVEVNPAFEQQTGLTQAVGKTIRELIPEIETFWFDIYAQVLRTGEPTRFQDHSAAMNRWFDIYAFRLEPAESNKVAVLFQDVTERRRIETEREAAREAADQANQIKDEFLAVLSHELRTPLNPILGWIKLLQSGKLDANQQRGALATIERNAKLQSRLIEDLLDISRIIQGKLLLNPTIVDLTQIISAAVETVRLAAAAKNIQLTLTFNPTAPVSADPVRLQQAICNLLTNAVKFTPDGGTVTVTLRSSDHRAEIQVIDTGKGIQPNFLPRIFDSFQQEDGSTTRKFGGLGLGLAIVQRIIEMHGGTVQAESQGVNHGATFIVKLPMNLQAQLSKSALEPHCPDAAQEGELNHVTVLLIDDDLDTREYQAFLLEQNGATVIAVPSGLAALQVLDQTLPNVIVSDLGMPEMDGYLLIRQIRARTSKWGGKIPAIAVSAYAGEFNQQQALEAGFQQHLAKPIEPEELIRAIATLSRSQA